MDGEEFGNFGECAAAEGEVAAQVGAMEKLARDFEKQVHISRAMGRKGGAFEEDGGAGDIGGRVAAGGGGPIDDDGAAAGEEDVAGMKIAMAESASLGKLSEGGLCGVPLIRCKVVGASEPISELFALGGKSSGSGMLVDLGVEFGEKACGVKEFPWSPLDELKKRDAVDALKDEAEAAFGLTDVVGSGCRKTGGMDGPRDFKF